MEKNLKLFLISVAALFLVACHSRFCAVDCQPPTQKVPVLRSSEIQDFVDQGILVYPKGQTLKMVIPTDKFFIPETPTIRQDKLSAMQHMVEVLKSYGPQATVEILGYTDTVNSKSQSRKQSLAKAQAVAAYFWAHGLDAEHLYAIGLGKTHLVGNPNDLVANAANRRVEVIVKSHCTTCF